MVDSIFDQKKKRAMQGSNPDAIQKQHAKGKKTARERIDAFLDSDTFHEIDMFVTSRVMSHPNGSGHPYTDGVVTGWGKVDGRTIYVYAQDFTMMGGSLGEAHGMKIAKLLDLAYQNGAPIVGFNDSGGARIQEGVDSLAAYGEIFYRNMRASGVIPQISVILGPCAGGAVYSPAITDFILMAEQNSCMFITGPDVIKAVTGEETDFESLGGGKVHGESSGVAHFVEVDEDAVLLKLRWLLSFLPSNNMSAPPEKATADPVNRSLDSLDDVVPIDPQRSYDVRKVIALVVDDDEFLEVQEAFAQNLVVGFARIDGQTVGVVANQPEVLAGVLDIDASSKGARFIRYCDAFHIPLVTFVDTPGFLPGIEQEHAGIIRHGAKMIFAFAEATVPKVSVILRKAYGGAYIVMSSKHLQGDINLAWPSAEIAVMGPEGAVNIIHRKQIDAASFPDVERERLINAYRDEMANPYVAASRGYLDDVIQPEDTRIKVAAALEMLRDKRVPAPARKHSNIPL